MQKSLLHFGIGHFAGKGILVHYNRHLHVQRTGCRGSRICMTDATPPAHIIIPTNEFPRDLLPLDLLLSYLGSSLILQQSQSFSLTNSCPLIPYRLHLYFISRFVGLTNPSNRHLIILINRNISRSRRDSLIKKQTALSSAFSPPRFATGEKPPAYAVFCHADVFGVTGENSFVPATSQSRGSIRRLSSITNRHSCEGSL
jgi:hypothetical protein